MRRLATSVLGLLVAWACSADERPPRFQAEEPEPSDAAGGLDIGLTDGPPGADAEGPCGNQIIAAVDDRPNLYFVVDRSGSMSLTDLGQSYDRYTMARMAIVRVLRLIGHRVQYGATVFPSYRDANDCAAGLELFSTTAGDPASYARAGTDGPVLVELATRLASVSPQGGTPVSATLRQLAPTLAALAGQTYVVLATDGAPNCNAEASCGVDECEPNLSRQVIGGRACNATFNCCDPRYLQDGPLGCIDTDASEGAVRELMTAGIPTFVIGMPGSEHYATVLDRLAVAGGTARASSPKYYPVTGSDELADTLRQIGVSVTISCDIALDRAPPNADIVNVYFDTSLVPFDETNGWTWSGDASLTLHGTACDRLLSGEVLQVQVVAGCTTVIP